MTIKLPKGWTRAKVRDVGLVQLGRQRSPDVHNGPNMRPYLRVANVYEDRLDLSDVMEMHFSEAELPRYELKPGDILLNEGQTPELLGRPAMYRGELPGACFTNSLIRFQAKPSVDPAFALLEFRHWMRAGNFTALAQITTNIAHLGAGRFAEMDIDVPPLGEQRRIVAKLESFQARSRRAREAIEAMPSRLDQLRQAVLASAFRGELTKQWREGLSEVQPGQERLERRRAERCSRWEDAEANNAGAKAKQLTDERWKGRYPKPVAADNAALPGLPDGWFWATVEELTSPSKTVCYGVVQPGDDPGDGVRLVRVCDLTGDGFTIDEQGIRRISATIDGEYRRSRLDGGELLVSVVGTIGRTALVPSSLRGANIARAIARLVFDRPLEAEWTACWFNTAFMQDYLNRESREVARKTLNIAQLLEVPIPVPGETEMRVVLDTLASARRMVTRIRTSAMAAADQLDLLDHSLLTKAFRGELVPQDPNDEPADVMLARLRQETAAESENPPRKTKPPRRQSASAPKRVRR